jgi:signal peptidase I
MTNFSRNGRTSVRSFRIWRSVLIGISVALILRALLVQLYTVESGSMAPTLQSNDRLLVWKLARFADLQRGDVVILDGTDTLAGAVEPDSPVDTLSRLLGIERLENRLFVKRIVAVGGDHLVCCDDQGSLLLNGKSLQEGYLPVGEHPSDIRFDVSVPNGHVWVMGDARSTSRDSRELLGRPGGGMVPIDMIVGRVAAVAWPPARMGAVS